MARTVRRTAAADAPVRAKAQVELYRKVSIRMWGDEKFRRLTAPAPSGQALWFFLLTGPFTIRIPGLVPVGEAAAAEKLKWPLEGFREAFREVSREGLALADWDAGLVWLPNGIKHNEPESPNVVIGWRAWWQFVPESNLKLKIYQGLRDHLAGMSEAFAEAFDKAYPEGWREGSPQPSRNQEQYQEQEQEHLSASPKIGKPGGLAAVGDFWEAHQKTPLHGKAKVVADELLAAGFSGEHLVGSLAEAIRAEGAGECVDLLGAWKAIAERSRAGGPYRWGSKDRQPEKAPPRATAVPWTPQIPPEEPT